MPRSSSSATPKEKPEASGDHGDAQPLPHGEAEREETEKGVRLAAELCDEAQGPVPDEKKRRYLAARPGFRREPPQDDEEQEALKGELVELRRMPRRVARVAEHHAPRYVGDPPIELAVDEIAHAAGREAERAERRDEIREPEELHPLAPRVHRHRDDDAEEAAVERHAALPDGEGLERVRCVVARLVEEHIAQPPAEDHAEDGEEDEVVELLARDGRAASDDSPDSEPPRRGEAHEVHEAVPAHGQRPDGEGDRVEVGMNEHGYLRRSSRAWATKSRAAAPSGPRGHASHTSSRGWRSASSR